MRIALMFLGVLSSLAVSSSGYAATVNATQGQVLLNQGQGYKQVAGSSEAGPGAIVVANPGSSAQVVYPDGRIGEVPGGLVLHQSRPPLSRTTVTISRIETRLVDNSAG